MMIPVVILAPVIILTFGFTLAWTMWLHRNNCQHNYVVHDIIDRKADGTEYNLWDKRIYVKRCTKCGHLHKQVF